MRFDHPERNHHPYEQFEGTKQWVALDKALDELSGNSDLEERTEREYIVGFLCKALAVSEGQTVVLSPEDADRAYVHAEVLRAQEMMRKANTAGRDLVAELSAERRTESEVD